MKLLSIVLAAALCASSAYARISTPYTGDDAWCVGPDGAEVCVDSSGNLLPTTDNDTTLGTSTYLWATIHAYDLSLSDDLTVTDDATINGKLLVDNATAADTPIRVLGASSQVGDLLLIETSPGTDVLRVKSLGEVLVGVGTPDTSQGEGDLYIASNLEVDAGSRFDGALDVNSSVDIDNATAASTALAVAGASSQVGDLLLIETSPGTDVVRVKSLGEVLIGVGTPDTTQGEGDLYVQSNLEVDAGARFDGALDINAGVDIDNATAGTTAIAVAGAASQTADLILAETSAGTDILRATPTGVLVRLLTMAQVDVTTPNNAGELVIVTDRTSTLYGICIATGTAIAQYKLATGTDVQTSGCGTGL